MYRTRNLRSALACIALAMAAACVDSTPSLTPNPVATLTTGNSPSFSMGDPGPQWPIKIHSTDARVTLPHYYETQNPQATLDASMRYDSYHARISASASYVGPNAFTQEFYPQERHTFWGFWNEGHHAQWKMPLPANCGDGNRLRADMKYEAWWIYQGGWAMDSQDEIDTDQQTLPDCVEDEEPSTGPGGGGPSDPGLGGGTGMVRCYTYTVDHYWYHPDTGVYQYRYTETETWCEDMT